MADVKSILDGTQAPNEVKAAAWDAFHSAGDPATFKTQFDKINLPKETKAALWDARFGQGGQASQHQGPAEQQEKPGFFKGLYDSTVGPAVDVVTHHPLETLTGIVAPAAYAAQHPIETAKDFGKKVLNGVAFAGMPPEVIEGNHGYAAGKATGTAFSFLAPELLKGKSLPVAPRLGANPKVVAASQEALREGVPINLGAVTDNRFVRGAQEVAASTMTGAPVAAWGDRAEKAGFTNWAQRLTSRAKPAVPPNQAYADWDAAASNPQNTRTIQTGTKTVQSGVVGPNGQPITSTVPVTQTMELPVKITDLKPQAQAFLKDRQGWSLAQKQSDRAYALAEMIVNSGDYIPARTAETALSGLKNTARKIGTDFNADTSQTTLRGQAQGFAQKLQAAIDRDVAAIDPKAAKSLQQGRQASAQQAGASWLEEVMSKGEAQGGLNRQDWMWNQWQNLDAAEKRVMFPSAAQRQSLDNLFLSMKRAANVSAGSRTAPLTAAGSSAQAVLTGAAFQAHPVLAVLNAITPAAFMRLAYSPKFVNAAIDGLKVSSKWPGATLKASNLMRVVEDLMPGPEAGVATAESGQRPQTALSVSARQGQ